MQASAPLTVHDDHRVVPTGCKLRLALLLEQDPALDDGEIRGAGRGRDWSPGQAEPTKTGVPEIAVACSFVVCVPRVP